MDKKRVLVMGLGKLGTALVDTLWKSDGVEVIAVDGDEELVDRIKSNVAACYVGDATEGRLLAGIRAHEADVAVVTFGEHFEASVLTVAELKRLGVKEIIARAATPSQASVLRTVGATRVLEVEQEMGYRLAIDLTSQVSSDLLEFAHGYRVVPWSAEGDLVGKTLAEAELPRRYEVIVLGISRHEQHPGHRPKLTPTRPDYVIAEGDVLMLVGEENAIGRFLADR